MLGAITLAVAAVIVLGSGRIFLRPHLFALYFSSDVNGLKVGAPVKFRGVEIGSVTAILLSVGTPRQNQKAEKAADQYRIPVIIDLETERLVRRGAATNLDDPAKVAQAIKRGLRGQLNVESLVTGPALRRPRLSARHAREILHGRRFAISRDSDGSNQARAGGDDAFEDDGPARARLISTN